MSDSPAATSLDQARPVAFGKRVLGWIGISVGLIVLLLAAVLWVMRPSPPIQLNLGDGRILQIEAVTYGVRHQAGFDSPLKRFRPWLPQSLVRYLSKGGRADKITLEQPALVVWVNAISEVGRTNVDCQGVRVEFVDQHGEVMGSHDSHWFGGPPFSRVGHAFYCYPRAEAELTFRVTPWKKGKYAPVTTTVTFSNPHVVQPANWTGNSLPQTNTIGSLEIVLKQVNPRTNESKYYQSATRYFEPVWELRERGLPAQGWDETEWMAEDSTGNRGLHLGLHHAALRFSATVYPSATNLNAAELLAQLPQIDLRALTKRISWNTNFTSGSNEIVALGICPPGVHVFSEGSFDTNGPTMTAVRGGAPSGWMVQNKQITPLKLKRWHGHYTPSPTIYVRPVKLAGLTRIAVRLRDEQGRYWVAEPEPQQGMNDDIYAFLLKLPSDVSSVTPEVILLKPVQAEFLASTKQTTSQ
ncbi:MAG TPA: hypothetical protein VFZ59_17395 [Verrucomicrobiae bacterium]|nr:hypothetical protein [Verrucomicrobiae bacterium]